MSNEPKTASSNTSDRKPEDAPSGGRRLLGDYDHEDPRAYEARLDDILSEGLRQSRPHD